MTLNKPPPLDLSSTYLAQATRQRTGSGRPREETQELFEEIESLLNTAQDILNNIPMDSSVCTTPRASEAEIDFSVLLEFQSPGREIDSSSAPLTSSQPSIIGPSSDTNLINFKNIETRKRVLSLPVELVESAPTHRFEQKLQLRFHPLRDVLRDLTGLTSFRAYINDQALQLLRFWEECEEFFSRRHETSRLCKVANELCLKYHHLEPKLPLPILDKLTPIPKNSASTHVLQVMRDRQFDAFEYMCVHVYPAYEDHCQQAAVTPRLNPQTYECNSFSGASDEANQTKYVLIDSEQVLVSAAIPKLIAELTSENVDHSFNFTFMLTHRYFLNSSHDLLLLLSKHYKNLAGSSGTSQPAQTKALLRTVNLLKLWLDIHPVHFMQDPSLVQAIQQFAEEVVQKTLPPAAKNLLSYMETKLSPHQEEEPFQFNSKPPKPKKILRSLTSTEQVSFEQIHPLEFARQITLLDQQLLRMIQPNELLFMNWTRNETKRADSPNLLAMIDQFNRTGQWVVSLLVTTHEFEKRSKYLQRLIQVAYETFKLQNYNSTMALVSGLKNSAVVRLKHTWDSLPSSCWDCWEELTAICMLDDNFARLREVVRSNSPPCIPYVGMYLSDLTFKEVEPNIFDGGSVNFGKMRSLADIVSKLKQDQVVPYCLESVPLIQEFLKQLSFIPESEYYENSQLCENKNRDSQSAESTVPKLVRRKTLFHLKNSLNKSVK